jgi:hypothetical protein
MKIQIKTPLSNLYSTINLLTNNKLTGFMQEWEKQSIEKAKLSFETQGLEDSKVSPYPNFHKKAPVIQLFDNSECLQRAFGTMSENADRRCKEILADAKKYHIKYDKNNIDYIHLSEQIDEYKILLQRANEQGLCWDKTQYDPIALEQKIEEDIVQERHYTRDQNSDYLSTR